MQSGTRRGRKEFHNEGSFRPCVETELLASAATFGPPSVQHCQDFFGGTQTLIIGAGWQVVTRLFFDTCSGHPAADSPPFAACFPCLHALTCCRLLFLQPQFWPAFMTSLASLMPAGRLTGSQWWSPFSSSATQPCSSRNAVTAQTSDSAASSNPDGVSQR